MQQTSTLSKIFLSDLYWSGSDVVMQAQDRLCQSPQELVNSDTFEKAVTNYIKDLSRRESHFLKNVLDSKQADQTAQAGFWLNLFIQLSEKSIQVIDNPEYQYLKNKISDLTEFAEHFYNYWRKFNRFLIWRSQNENDDQSHMTNYRQLNSLVRKTYRVIMENIKGSRPAVLRQLPSAVKMSVTVSKAKWPTKTNFYDPLKQIDHIREVLISPPLLLDPPMNKRTGKFIQIDKNPLAGVDFNSKEWVCYPAQVGPLVIHIYFHIKFMGLGCSVSNLFELATPEQLKQKPDAVYAYGVPGDHLYQFAKIPNLVYHDQENDLWVGAIPGNDDFGYFGYVKKMTLTLHNIVMMTKYGRMPYHGAMTRIVLRNGAAANVAVLGDSGTGKSETLEAFRAIGGEELSELTVIADDMGSFDTDKEGNLIGYGTEIGAFVRLDDLQPGYAFQQLDRAIIMSPQKINARCVIPITTLEEVLKGHKVDFLLYANNYDDVDEEKPVIEAFQNSQDAIEVFSQGLAMSKGTTTSTGLVHNYYANIFGPPLFKELHDELAQKYFKAAFDKGVYVGQMRTRLGKPGFESQGPQESAKALFKMISERNKK